MDASLSIYRKGLILVGVPLLSQLLFLGVLAEMRAQQAAAQRMALHTKDVIADAEAVFRTLVEAHNAVRAYVFFGDPVYRDVYQRAAGRGPGVVARLTDQVRDNPAQVEQAGRVGAAARGLADLQADLARMAGDGRRAEATELIRVYEGQRRIDAVRAEVDAFLAAEERLDRDRMAALDRVARLQLWVLASGVVLALASTGLLLWLFSRGFARRVATLRDNARRLADGKDLTARLPGDDEIGQLDRVFHDMADALAQRNRENEMFVYSVSHDLRSPLVNLQGFSQELAAVAQDVRGRLDADGVPPAVRDGVRQLIDRDMAESVHFIQTAVARLSAIIDALLRLSRIGRVEYRMQEVDTRAVAVRVAEALRGTLAEKGAAVDVGPLPPCWGDPTAVEQVFANLVGNAVNYLDPARLGRVEVGGGEVDVHGRRVYHVRDNGLGIPADHLPKVFSAFQRLHPTVATGEGIGLALVRRVMDRHGGRIWVESEPGVGTTFFVAFPAAPDAAPGRSA
jgi:signal transduction histidine kinase